MAEENYGRLQRLRIGTDREPEEIRRTALVFGRRRVWQQQEDNQILLIEPRFEGLMNPGGDDVIRRAGEYIFLEGEISCVYISRVRGGANENLLDHLAKVKWT